MVQKEEADRDAELTAAQQVVVEWRYNLDLVDDKETETAWNTRISQIEVDEDEDEEDIPTTLRTIFLESGMQWGVRRAIAQRALGGLEPGSYVIHPDDETPERILTLSYVSVEGYPESISLHPTNDGALTWEDERFVSASELIRHFHLTQPIYIIREPRPFPVRSAEEFKTRSITLRQTPQRRRVPTFAGVSDAEPRTYWAKQLFRSWHMTEVADMQLIEDTLRAAGEGSYIFTPTRAETRYLAELHYLDRDENMVMEQVKVEGRGYSVGKRMFESLADIADELGLSEGLSDTEIFKQLKTPHTIHEALGTLKGQPNGFYVLNIENDIPFLHYVVGDQAHTKDLTIESGEHPIRVPWDRYHLQYQVIEAPMPHDLLDEFVTKHDRKQATQILKRCRPGEFILRRSEKTGKYAVSVKRRGNIEHIPLAPSPNPNSRRVDVDGTLIAVSHLIDHLSLEYQILDSEEET